MSDGLGVPVPGQPEADVQPPGHSLVTALGSRRLRTEVLFEAAPTAASHFSSKTSSRVDAERFQTVAGERELRARVALGGGCRR